MLIKFEVKSPRVKGLSFHSMHPWILASLHNGTIQLWDYRVRTLLEKYEEHEGPVRGICFHDRQPLFVSGGDDYKVKVWNYKQKRCIFNLLGHLDYVRTTKFHQEYPWIVSSSDDQTIRIWNWQSRTCVCILTGHNHYVMCAEFHQTEDLVVSASLDQTVRVWDISGLRKKNVVAPGACEVGKDPVPELFGQPNAVVRHVIEGHLRGVNWVSFHPKLPLIVSSADDRLVKLWRMNDLKAWEIDTCRGHTNNVSCVIFHPNQDLLLSNSEDKSIRVWDMVKRTCVQSFRREYERFWTLASHPSLDLFAGGHDGGLVIFKLERERPTFTLDGGCLHYIKDKALRRFDFATRKDVAVREINVGKTKSHRLSFNPSEGAFLISTQSLDEQYYDIYLTKNENKRSQGCNALWIGPNRFVILDKARESLIVKDLENLVRKKIQIFDCDDLYPAGARRVLLKNDETLTLYDVQKQQELGKIKVAKTRRTIWCSNMQRLAVLAKNTLTICDQKLQLLYAHHESTRIKSGAWHEDQVFVYTTSNHIKYLLPNGDHGIVRTLNVPIYITKISDDQLFCLDRECRVKIVPIDCTEFKFKISLASRNFQGILSAVKSSRLVGQSIIAYLQQKGFHELALMYVKDEKTRFGLAIECGNIEVALEAAKILNDRICWLCLAETALMRGNHQIAEMCYQRTKSYDKLSFLYLITGNIEKLGKMLKIAEIRRAKSGQFQNALVLGDVREIISVQKSCALNNLVRLTEFTYFGIQEECSEFVGLKPESKAKFMRPPPPIQQTQTNWPLLAPKLGFFDNLQNLLQEERIMLEEGVPDGWDNMVDVKIENSNGSGSVLADLENNQGDGWENTSALTNEEIFDGFGLPDLPSKQPASLVLESNNALDHIIWSSFGTACEILHRQFGVVSFQPYRKLFMYLYSSSRTILTWQERFPQHNLKNPKPPLLLYENLEFAYDLTTHGKFKEAHQLFGSILLRATLLPQKNELRELLKICRNYILGLKMECARKSLSKDEEKRRCEMAVYFTHVDLQAFHKILTLRTALNACFRVKNYKTARSIAERLLEMGPNAEIAQRARQILRACEVNLVDQLPMVYDERNPFNLCGFSYSPIYFGMVDEKCPLCKTSYLPKYKGCVCNVCDVAEIGLTINIGKNII